VIVADTNAVVYLLLRSDLTPAAEIFRAMDGDWVCPPLFLYEFANVLSVHMGVGRIDRDEAVRFYRRALRMVRIEEYMPEPAWFFNMCSKRKCSAYDLQFVALAMHLGVRLLTADAEVLRAFPDVAIDLQEFNA